MLFFFELFLFVLVMLTLALGEFVSRWLALVLWLVVTVCSLGGYVLVRYALGDLLAGNAGWLPAERERGGAVLWGWGRVVGVRSGRSAGGHGWGAAGGAGGGGAGRAGVDGAPGRPGARAAPAEPA